VNSIELDVDSIHFVKLASLEQFSEIEEKKHSNKNNLLEHICEENSLGLGFQCFLIQPFFIPSSKALSIVHLLDPFLSWCSSSPLFLDLRRTWELKFVGARVHGYSCMQPSYCTRKVSCS